MVVAACYSENARADHLPLPIIFVSAEGEERGRDGGRGGRERASEGEEGRFVFSSLCLRLRVRKEGKAEGRKGRRDEVSKGRKEGRKEGWREGGREGWRKGGR